MKAVILAAGKGERLSKGKSKLNAKPKPLIPLLGLSLLERAILSAKESGIYDFVIVVGYRSEEVVKYVEEKQNRLGLNIDFVENEEWEKGNGLSVLKARETLKEEDFVLLMCDHVFDSSILKELLEYAKNRERKCVLCVDEPENVFDLEDATKILLERNKPNAIGKGIKNYNAVDCGIFYCTAEMLDALEAEIGKGKYELSDAVQCLIDCDKLEVFDIGGRRFWCDIDTQESLEYAKNKMLKSLEKPTDGIISKCINRKISKRITARIVNTNLTPTQITIISFIMALASAAFFLLGEHKYLVIGGILAQASSIIDGCDGEVARLKFLTTDYGAFVDSILDRYADGIMILGLIFGYWMLHGGISVWIIGLFALIGSFMISYTNARYEGVFERPGGGRGIPIRRDMRVFMIMIGAFLNQVLVMLLLLAILTNLEVVRRVFSIKRIITKTKF
ncbi:MAG: NTP transferase domain-containing protein [Candidatus Syntrophoarchaeum sp.]|nr:NTP transferase domain-containing protein [Candidatus Syntrophoarchaeum sp.]